MEKQVHFKCTLHKESPGQGRFREIEVVEHTDHFELLIFEGELLRSDQSTSAQPYFGSVSFLPTRDAARNHMEVIDISLAEDRLVLPLAQTSGNIWILDNVDR